MEFVSRIIDICLILLCVEVIDTNMGKPATLPDTIMHKQEKNRISISICKKLNLDNLFRHKSAVDEKLVTRIRSVKNNRDITDKSKLHRLKAITVFQRELNDSVTSLYNSVDNLKSFLKGDYRSIHQLKQIGKNRLEQLQNAMLKAEDEYNVIMQAEKEEQDELKHNRKDEKGKSKIQKFVDDLIGGISIAADQLESKLDDDAFEHEIHSKNNKIAIETVIKVGGKVKHQGIIFCKTIWLVSLFS